MRYAGTPYPVSQYPPGSPVDVAICCCTLTNASHHERPPALYFDLPVILPAANKTRARFPLTKMASGGSQYVALFSWLDSTPDSKIPRS